MQRPTLTEIGSLEARMDTYAGSEQRGAQRIRASLEGRLTWRDTDGRQRTARVRTRDVSRTGAYVECVSGCGPIALYRLVDLRLDSPAREGDDLPTPFRRPRIAAAVYRIGSPRKSTGLPNGYALRLLVGSSRGSLDADAS